MNAKGIVSNYIPVFAYPLDPADYQKGWTPYQALATAPERLWSATSRNWWFQGFLQDQLATFPGHDGLRYLLEDLALVPVDQVALRAQEIHRLLAAFRAHPDLFHTHGSSYISRADDVAAQLDQAQVLRSLDDDSMEACSNFFSYLLSQAAALDEAADQGKALLYIRPMPV